MTDGIERLVRSLKDDLDRVTAERDRLRTLVGTQTDPLLEHYQDMEGQYRQVTADRDSMRTAVERTEREWADMRDARDTAIAERDRLQAIVAHLRETAESGIEQDRDDEYDEGNCAAWMYVRNVIDGKAGT